MIHGLEIAALGLSATAALFGLRAVSIPIRDNMDAFIGDLHRQGRWAAWAALVNALAVAALVAIQFLRV